jgi:hypothetical protein
MLTLAFLFHYLLQITLGHFSHEKFIPLTQAVLVSEYHAISSSPLYVHVSSFLKGILADETIIHPFVVS